MPKKLLKKSRNRHLQLAENLIPNQAIKRNVFSYKYKPVNNTFASLEEEICNQWVFSWSAFEKCRGIVVNYNNRDRHLKGSTLPPSAPSEQKKRDGVEKKPEILLQTVLPIVEAMRKIMPENSFAHPAEHSLEFFTNQAAGGNLLGYLNRHVQQQYSISGQGLKDTHIPTCHESLQCTEKKEFPRKAYILASPSQIVNKKEVQTTLSIRWNAQFLSVADFLKRQSKKIYSFDEIQRGRDRIGDQCKRQYMERKKISVLYGNLPKRTLVRVMRTVLHTSNKTGAINERFLSALETRLDVVLKRSFLFPTIGSARQWIRQGKILVNNCTCTSAGFLLQPGDFIALSKQARTAWRGFWCAHAGHQSKGADGTIANEQLGQFSRRRYPLAPPLMQKLQKWSRLWGSLLLQETAQKSQKWTQCSNLVRRKKSMHPFFASSCLNYYLKKNYTIRAVQDATPLENSGLAFVARHRETRCTNWLKRFTTTPQLRFSNKKRPQSNPNSTGLTPRGTWTERRLERQAHPKKRHLFRQKVLAALLLHREAANVADGLYSHRYNKALAFKKSLTEKKKGWQFNYYKPMHLECCYKQASAIFLYPPQKLVWPCNINACLLKQELIG